MVRCTNTTENVTTPEHPSEEAAVKEEERDAGEPPAPAPAEPAPEPAPAEPAEAGETPAYDPASPYVMFLDFDALSN